MKTSTWIAIAFAAGSHFATEALASEAHLENIAVCAGDNINPYVSDHAQMEASQIFRQIGFHLSWHAANSEFCRKNSGPMLQVTYSLKTGDQDSPGALAYAQPYEGIHIEVFYDRLPGASDNIRSHVLAHVLAHEISHVLQGTDRHSATGLMKARWGEADFVQMAGGDLPFAGNDVRLIHEGFSSWRHRAEPAMFVALAKR